MASRLTHSKSKRKKVSACYQTGHTKLLLDKLSILFNIPARTKLLETLIINEVLLAVEVNRDDLRGPQKVAFDYLQRFAQEYKQRLEVLRQHDRQGTDRPARGEQHIQQDQSEAVC